MLAHEVATAVRPRPRMSAGSSSSPTRNMKKTMPYSLSTLRYGSASRGKSAAERSGASHPSRDGPSRMPPTTSPTTCGCPTARSATPTRRAAARMTNISTLMRVSRRSAGIGRALPSGPAAAEPAPARGARGAAHGHLGPPLLWPDPDLPAAEVLPLPDGNDLLQAVDQPVAGSERLGAVPGRDRDADARLTHRHEPDAVHHRDPAQPPASRRRGGETAHLALRHAGERLVLQAHDAPAGVFVARRAEKRDDR